MSELWMDAAALALAVAWDLSLGEPPNAIHSVVGIGKAIGLLERIAPKANRIAQFTYGLMMALLLPAALAAAAYFLATWLKDAYPPAYIVVAAILLKTCFSIRGLITSAKDVRASIEADDQVGSSELLTHLVSRDTSKLTPEQSAAATIESVAENTTDSFVAPWLYFAIFGLPGAFAYRAVNTLDSMIGYRGKYEYLGKASARLDDLLNLVPARIAALTIAAVSPLCRLSLRRSLRTLFKEGHHTSSPNAGLTMAAMAGALGVVLEKAGNYTLGVGLRQPTSADITKSIQVMKWVAVFAVLIAFVLLAVHHVFF
ncbi:MAG: cobalamin biosynthesis protein [Chloroflexota bacterium]|nr:cobalamin biosynthesis protein [Chloroflexota bacterium]